MFHAALRISLLAFHQFWGLVPELENHVSITNCRKYVNVANLLSHLINQSSSYQLSPITSKRTNLKSIVYQNWTLKYLQLIITTLAL